MRMHIKHPTPQAIAAAKLKELEEKRRKEMAPPKFCKDCHWHKFKEIPLKDRFIFKHFCTYPPLLDQITGEPSNAQKNRNSATLCGPSAIYHTQRVARMKGATEGAEG